MARSVAMELPPMVAPMKVYMAEDPRRGKHLGGLADVVGGDPGDLSHLFRRIGRQREP